jgi:hypothetical protein
MIRRSFFLFAAVAVGSLPLFEVSALAGSATFKSAGQQSGGRVIVTLRETSEMKRLSGGNDAEEEAYRAANLALQESVILKVFGTGPANLRGRRRSLEQLESVAMFSLIATTAEVRALRADRRVKSVQTDEIRGLN